MGVETQYLGDGIIYLKLAGRIYIADLNDSQDIAMHLLAEDNQTQSVVVIDLTNAAFPALELNINALRNLARRDRTITKAFVMVNLSPGLNLFVSALKNILRVSIIYADSLEQGIDTAYELLQTEVSK